MMSAEEAARRHAELISRLIDGECSEELVVELRGALCDSAACRNALVEQLILDSLLHEELGADSLTALVDVVAESGSYQASTAGVAGAATPNIGSSRSRRQVGWLAAAMCLGGIVFGLSRWEPSSVASAAIVIQAAESVHAEQLERVYVVESERSEAAVPFVPPRDVRVATRGDRFFVTMSRGPRQWIWGCDAAGSIWMTVGKRRAIVVEDDELGPALRYVSDLYSLEIETLLRNFRRHCRLEQSQDESGDHVIRVVPRFTNARGGLRKATIEVDRESKVVRRLVLDREFPEYGKSTVTFTLVDTRPATETDYSPAGHLEERYELLSRATVPDRRRELLTNWFGSPAERWIVTPE
jgi:hypothetical protein